MIITYFTCNKCKKTFFKEIICVIIAMVKKMSTTKYDAEVFLVNHMN